MEKLRLDNPVVVPRLLSFRSADKRPEDATTVREIIALYAQQGRRITEAT